MARNTYPGFETRYGVSGNLPRPDRFVTQMGFNSGNRARTIKGVMTAPGCWLTPTRTLLLLLFLLTLVSVSSLALFGLRLLDQQRMVDAEQSQERLEQAADRITANARGTLADVGERLEAGVVTPGDVLFRLSSNSLEATPSVRLLYYPLPPPDPEPNFKVFAEAELFEFSEAQPNEALRVYDRLSSSRNSEVRDAALLRAARVERNLGRVEESLSAYRTLADSDALVAGVPAALIAKHEICSLTNDPGEIAGLVDDLRSGRWRLTRGEFEFYWSEAVRMSGRKESLPADKTRLTEIAEFVWRDRANHPVPGGHELVWIAGGPVVLTWRGSPEQRRVLAARPESFVQESRLGAGMRYAFVDAEGRTLAGFKDPSQHSVVRTAAETGLPWTLFVSETGGLAEGGLI